MQDVSVVREVASNAPIPVMATLVAYVDTYGALLLFALSIGYAIMQFRWRRKEHKAMMTQHAWREKWHEEGKYP
jgi:hypothetical protein